MLNKLMETVNVVAKEDASDTDIYLEDCGEIDERLEGYYIVINEEDITGLQDIYDEIDPSNSNHVSLILNNRRGAVIVYTAITNQAGQLLTTYGLERCGDDVDTFLDEYSDYDKPPRSSYANRTQHSHHSKGTEYQSVEYIEDCDQDEHDYYDEEEVFSPEDFRNLCSVVVNKVPEEVDYINELIDIYNSGDIKESSDKLLELLDDLTEQGILE